jgi:hypothetical protein
MVILFSATIRAQETQQEKPSAISRDQQPPAAEKKISSGAIKGRVVEGGRPVADASITVLPVNFTSKPQSLVTMMFRPVNSDADGQFQITGLTPGAYTIQASAPGYVSDTSLQQYYRIGDNVTLSLVRGGVITGTVTNSSGEPVVGAVVRAIKIRDTDNNALRSRGDLMSQLPGSSNFILAMLGPFKTDDRGIYRIYGLEAGYYQVAAGGRQMGDIFGGSGASAYDGDAPTYFPSSTMATAAEVIVRPGNEATSIDIRYRDHKGHSISGTVSGGKVTAQQGIQVYLTRAGSGITESTTFVLPTGKDQVFAFDSLLDGEYFVTALAGPGGMMGGTEDMNASLSPAHRVTISGSDITGVELVIEPLASITGRAVLESIAGTQKAECAPGRRMRLEEVVISTKRETIGKPEDQSLAMLVALGTTSPDEKGEFTSNLLRPGVQHLGAQIGGENYYVKSMTLPPSTPNGKPIDAGKGIRLKSGDKLKGLVVSIKEGAALLSGKVETGNEGKPPSEKVRVYLVPAETEAADDVLRYFESDIASDGGFALRNLPPGQYWLLAREVSDQEQSAEDHKPLAWDPAARTALRVEGGATKKILEFGACQQVTGFALRYTPPSKATKPAPKPTP